ncbi:MAG TPA: DUF262 domain-containing HNH endonuclease family protein [Falsiroseomonas sp.]|jgi:hypothetical protein|nr:DUF262 domain-containing HNH endonuclease family protein [Falsiroseomonas sp.]
MSNIDSKFQGIGTLIGQGRLRVPINQRDYAWDEEHVVALCNDITEAIASKKDSYFLGTVVLTKTADDYLEIVDGQQRLATSTIILAVIRDILHGMGEAQLVNGIEGQYLYGIDLKSEENTPYIQLNTRDNEYFATRVIPTPGEDRRAKKTRQWTEKNKIANAARIIRQHLEEITKSYSSSTKKETMKDWIEFLRRRANLIVLTVPDSVNAYVMFETLNDRGLRVSQADLVKNYLFGEAGSRLKEAQAKWASMVRSLELVDQEDTTIDYLRLLSTLLNGLTRERQVFERIKAEASSPTRAIALMETLDEFAIDYAAMLTSNHWKWGDYPPDIQRSISTLDLLGSTQIRHLMLAVAHHFNKNEAAKAFRLFVNWIVRLFIAGSGRVGRVESIYASMAYDIHKTKDLRSATALAERMAPHLASDTDFEAAFAIAHVGRPKIARYYLDALERKLRGDGSPDLVPNADVTVVNLEHVLPLSPTDDDPASELASFQSRLGNLVLLNARQNAMSGNDSFERKKAVLLGSPFLVTQRVGSYKTWGPTEINEHQRYLAKLAIDVWSLRSR